MKTARTLMILLGGLVASGCGDDPQGAGAPLDPGQAGTVYGPKMGGEIALSSAERLEVRGTATAISRDGRDHFFMIPDVTYPPRFSKAYLSIWLPATGWKVRSLTDADVSAGLGVNIVFSTPDGREYSLGGGQGGALPAGSFTLNLDKAGPFESDPSTYALTGRLQARLRARAAPHDEVPLTLQINAVAM